MTTTYFSPNLLAALLTALTIKFSIKDLKLETADSVTFTEDILNGKLHFLSSEMFYKKEHLFSKTVKEPSVNCVQWFGA